MSYNDHQGRVLTTGEIAMQEVATQQHSAFAEIFNDPAVGARRASPVSRLREQCARKLGLDFSSFLVIGRGGTAAAPDEPAAASPGGKASR